MKGKYFLDIIDDELYSTNSWEIYNWYNHLYYNTPLGEPEKRKIKFRG